MVSMRASLGGFDSPNRVPDQHVRFRITVIRIRSRIGCSERGQCFPSNRPELGQSFGNCGWIVHAGIVERPPHERYEESDVFSRAVIDDVLGIAKAREDQVWRTPGK